MSHIPTPTTGLTDREIELRQNYIGASESAAIMGFNPFANATDIYHQKANGIVIPETRAMRIGRLYEPMLLDYATEEVGQLSRSNRRRVHPDGVLQATVDAFVVGKPEIVETKKVMWWTYNNDPSLWGDSGTDQVPPYHLIQCQHQMEVVTAQSGETIQRCWLAVCIGDDDFRIYKIPRNPKIGKAIVKAITKFWYEHVVPGIQPDGEPAHMDILKDVPRDNPEVCSGISDYWLRMYDLGSRWAKRGESLKDEAKRYVINEMGDHEIGVSESGRKVTFKTVNRTRFDTTQFAKDHPILSKRYTVPSPSRQFRA